MPAIPAVSLPFRSPPGVLILQTLFFALCAVFADKFAPAIFAGLGVASITALIASLFATWSIRDLLQAWRNLIGFSRAPSIQLQLLEDSTRLDLPVEFRELLHNLEAMARRLVSE